jgi:hypothetical protein
VVTLLDASLLMTAPTSAIRSLLQQQQQQLKRLEDEDALVAAYIYMEHMEAAAARHGLAPKEYLYQITRPATLGDEASPCDALLPSYRTRQLEPAATHILRTASKVRV